MNTNTLSDEQLVARVKRLCAAGAQITSSLLVDLLDIEDRRLHLKEACSSMYDYCKRRLDMSPNQAWRRTTAARLVRRVPILLGYVQRGDIDLSTLVLLRNFITDENAEELVQATRRRSKRQVQRLLEMREPRPEVAGRLRKRPHQPATASNDALLERLDAVDDELYRLEVTIADKTRVLIERARDMLAGVLPSASLGDVVHHAFAKLVETLELSFAQAAARSRAKTHDQPSASDRDIPAATRRAVFLRDGYRCTYVNDRRERCPAVRFLHVDHIVPRALGGTNDIKNLRCACYAHNLLFAEEAFGKQYVQRRIRARRAAAKSKKSAKRPEG